MGICTRKKLSNLEHGDDAVPPSENPNNFQVLLGHLNDRVDI